MERIIKTKFFCFILFVTISVGFTQPIGINYQQYYNLNSIQLKQKLKSFMSQGHHAIGYTKAKTIMFSKLDAYNGKVCSVYSPKECVVSGKIPDHKKMNCEHTWPKSKGAKGSPKVSDLHHLYPATSDTNSVRSSFPFCEVEEVHWEHGGSYRGYSAYNNRCFEPPDHHKGNVARAIFYFAVRYNYQIDDHQEYYLRKWHFEDPVNQDDQRRNYIIHSYQKNSNIFIEDPELVNHITDF